MRLVEAKPIRKVLLLVSLFLGACGGGGNTTICSPVPVPVTPPVVTSMGTDFYLTLPDHLCVSVPSLCPTTSVTNKLIVAAPTATSGEVSFYGVVTPFTVTAGGETVISLDLPSQSAVLTTNEVVESKGIHVTSVSPISVHVVSESAVSADGYLALPTAGLGTSYYVMSYPSATQTGSEFAVVATQNNTTVTITPKAAGLTKPANVAFTVMLNSGETYQLENPAFADMTGTLVNADKPIAVFSGHRFGNVPSGTNYGDYLVEQLPPVSIWGKTHHTSLFSGRTNYTVRILASQDGTTFSTSPSGLLGTLNAGEFADVTLSGVGEFVSNNPVLLAQFMHGYAYNGEGKGDPSMVIVTPAEQAMTDATFGVHGLSGSPTTGTLVTYMNVVTETAALANLKLDNVTVDLAVTPFATVGGTSIYSTGAIPVAPGTHSLNGSAPFSAMIYDSGVAGKAVSYAYPVAAKLSGAASTTPATVTTTPAVCLNTQIAANDQSHDDDHEEHDSEDHHDHHDHHDHQDHHGDEDGHEFHA